MRLRNLGGRTDCVERCYQMFGDAVRLRKYFFDSGCISVLCQSRTIVHRAHQHDGGWSDLTNLPGCFDAVHDGHLPVEDDDVGV